MREIKSETFIHNFVVYYIVVSASADVYPTYRMLDTDGVNATLSLEGIYSFQELFQIVPALRRKKVVVTHSGYRGFPRRPRKGQDCVTIQFPVERREWIQDNAATAALAAEEAAKYLAANKDNQESPQPNKRRRFLFQQPVECYSAGYREGGWAGVVEAHLNPPCRHLWRERYPEIPFSPEEEEIMREQTREREELPILHSALGDEDGD